MQFAPLSEEELGPKLAKLLSPATPEKIVQGFARGILPGFSPDQMLKGWYQLALRGDEWREWIKDALVQLPPSAYFSAFSTELPSCVLGFLATQPIPPNVLPQLVMLPATPGEAIAEIARTAPESLCIVIGENQARLLQYPPIIEALYMNPNTPMSLSMRIIELAARHQLELQLAAYDEMVKALDLEEAKYEDPLDAELAQAEIDERYKQATTETEGRDWDLEPQENENPLENTDENDPLKPNANVPRNLGKLPVFARIRLAQLGNRFVRSQLIRDSNKLVAMAVIKSPGMTDIEVEEYSKNRQLSEDVIRYIAHRKDWLKSYRVKTNLVNNPKTPVTVALQLLSHLRDNDLRAVARSKNVQQAVRSAAMQRLNTKK